ncbi:hypothetical protein [Halothiobacillus sp.]|uniref:hypothetical protein n=1 Tax=Halothiobacillus sp. TaxID=1891311 RepID=UPI00260AA5C6|nr:hypothetical protein [Halothiobacillus sp.]MDD4966918.1 hypothetical protein [Halothiobacillus sp.]MDY0148273.1 hypothetical protein [Halothiobacillus sp.]
MSQGPASSPRSVQMDTQVMLQNLAAAVTGLTDAHQKLADMLAAPDRTDSGASLDEVIIAIREGHARLEEAELHRQSWLAAQPINSSSTKSNARQDMHQALTAIDRAEFTNHLASWLALQPLISELDERTREHQMVIARLGLFIQERVNLLTNAADGSDTAVYAASGKTSAPADRRRSLGDA